MHHDDPTQLFPDARPNDVARNAHGNVYTFDDATIRALDDNIKAMLPNHSFEGADLQWLLSDLGGEGIEMHFAIQPEHTHLDEHTGVRAIILPRREPDMCRVRVVVNPSEGYSTQLTRDVTIDDAPAVLMDLLSTAIGTDDMP